MSAVRTAQVRALQAQGLTERAIAERLELSRSTVRVYMKKPRRTAPAGRPTR